MHWFSRSSADTKCRHDAQRRRVRRDRDITRRLFLHGHNNVQPLMRRTLRAAYNSVTEYADHYVHDRQPRVRSPAYRLNAAWFGPSAHTKMRAYQQAADMIGHGT